MAIALKQRWLFTWQYAADAAYILMYYSNLSAGEVVFEIWDASTADKKEKLQTVTLKHFWSSDLASLKLFAINDVVYIAHDSVPLQKIWVERLKDGTTGLSTNPRLSFYVGDIDINIDPVLTEYANRNKFRVSGQTGGGMFKEGDPVVVRELPITDKQEENGAESIFKASTNWWRPGDYRGQMLMLKRSTEMAKTYGLLYPDYDSSSNSSRVAITSQPPPSDTSSTEYGGRLGDVENTEYGTTYDPKNDWASEWMFMTGKISVETTGKWSGKIVVDKWTPDMKTLTEPLSGTSYVAGDPAEWETLAVIDVHNAMSNKSVERDLNEPGTRIRLRCVRRERSRAVAVNYDDGKVVYKETDNDTGCFITVSCAQEIPIYLRFVSIDGEETATEMDGNGNFHEVTYQKATFLALHPFDGKTSFESTSFAEGAWSEIDGNSGYGFPRTVGVFQERLVFAGNKNKPCTFWCSKTDDWTNFIQGSDSTSPIFGTANTDNLDAMQWMQITKSYIMFGSRSGEWYFGATDNGSVTPSNYCFKRLSNYGSTLGIDAVLFGNSTIVAKNGGKQIMDVSYNTLSETGDGANLSLYAEHLFENDRMIALTTTRSPKLMLWALTYSGKLCSFTYEQNNNVFAWTRNYIHDGVLDIASFRRDETDCICMLVKQGNNIMLGELNPRRGIDDYDKDDSSPFNNRYIFMDELVDSTDESPSFVNYESRIVPTPIKPIQNDQVYGQKMAFSDVDIYLKTFNGDFDGDIWADGTRFNIKLGVNPNAKPVVCDNGFSDKNTLQYYGENRIKLPVSSGWSDEGLIDIWTDYPAPLTIVAIGAEIALPPNGR